MGRFLINLLLAVFALSVALPLLWVLTTSLKLSTEVTANPWALPAHPHWGNYVAAWSGNGLGRGFLNSFIVTLFSLLILLPVGAMAAYVFVQYPFRGSKFLFMAFLGGMMFPIFLAIVPLFLMMTQLGLLDTLTGLILVYVAFSLPFTVFVLFGFFQTQPRALLEAAMIDGCGHAQAFWRVMLPLATPGLVVVGIFNAIGLWNEYPLALVLISSDQNRTLPLAIATMTITQHYQSDWGALFAGLVIVILPVLIVYWLFRDRIHEVMLAGAIKG